MNVTKNNVNCGNGEKQNVPSQAAVCILKQIENARGVWSQGWTSSIIKPMRPFNPVTGTVYRGVNALNLYLPLLEKLLADPSYQIDLRFSTLRQINLNTGRVRPGSKASYIICFIRSFLDSSGKVLTADTLEQARAKDPDATEKRSCRTFAVFNYANVEWSDESRMEKINRYRIDNYALQSPSVNIQAEQLLEANSVRVLTATGIQPSFVPHENVIYVPRNEDFQSESSKWEALFHELIHWTKKNLPGCDRNFCYAQEELTAELGSLMLCQELGIDFRPGQKEGMLAYLHSWLSPFKEEQKLSAIDEALRAADKAINILLSRMKLKQQG
ncbi:MAG: zincin-like metallopeptidase domain-containing protein [Succinivibrionaceae bacterium]